MVDRSTQPSSPSWTTLLSSRKTKQLQGRIGGTAQLKNNSERTEDVVMPVWMGTGAPVAAKVIQSRWKAHGWNDGHHGNGTWETDFINLTGTNSTVIQKRIASSSTGSHFFSSNTWYSKSCCQDSKFACSPTVKWTKCKRMLTRWPDERWAGVDAEL